jgi:hypothetical protein
MCPNLKLWVLEHVPFFSLVLFWPLGCNTLKKTIYEIIQYLTFPKHTLQDLVTFEFGPYMKIKEKHLRFFWLHVGT